MSIKQIGKYNIPTTGDVAKFKRTMPIILANTAKNHFLLGFRKGGKQTDKSRGGWRPRKSGSQRNRGRAILVDTSALKHDIDKRRTTFSRTVVGTSSSVPYAVYHNEGTKNTVQREIIGDSKVLEKKMEAKINKKITAMFKF